MGSCERTMREFSLSKMHEKEDFERQRSKSRSRLGSLKSIESHKSGRSTKSYKKKKNKTTTSKLATNKTKKSTTKVNRNQTYQTDVHNSKNSTIVHRCKAGASSARPYIVDDPSAAYLQTIPGCKGHQLNEILMNQAKYG